MFHLYIVAFVALEPHARLSLFWCGLNFIANLQVLFSTLTTTINKILWYELVPTIRVIHAIQPQIIVFYTLPM